MPTSNPTCATSRLALFAAAVAATAATFGIYRAIAKQAGNTSYYVRFTSPAGYVVDTEPTRSAKAALHRLERAIQNDFIHLT